jgi:hypothetical protein
VSEDLVRDQEVLGRALESARAGEDKALAQQVRESGEQMVRLLTGLWRLMRTHSPDNHAFDAPTRDFSAVLSRLIDLLGPVHLVSVEGQIYINDIRIRMDERIGGAADLCEELGRHGSGGMSFSDRMDEPLVRRMLHVLAAKPATSHPLATLSAAMRDAGITTVTLHGLYRLRLTGESGPVGTPVAADVQSTLQRAAGLVSEAWDNLAESRAPNPLPVRRLVNDIIDRTGFAEQFLEAEQSGPSVNAAAHARHSLRVCTLAVMIGADLGLPNAALADLGVAAMFHDVGYGAKEDGFSPPFERHGSAGLRMLLRQRGFHTAKIKRMLVALEHHEDVGQSPTLYARIVHIADDFDTLTRHRAGGAFFGPAHALERMDGAAGVRYDATLLQILVNRLGKYPPGTLLRLRDGRWVISVSGARSAATFAAPLCRVIRDEAGRSISNGAELDLAVEGQVARVIPVRA